MAFVAMLAVAGTAVAGPAGESRAVASTPSVSTGPEVSDDDQWEIVVSLCTPTMYGCHKRYATKKQRRALHAFLAAIPELTEVTFIDRAAMYENFRRDFAANRPLLKEVKAKDLPESFRLRVKEGADRGRTVRTVYGGPGVGEAIDLAEVYGASASGARRSDAAVYLCKKGSAMPACRSGRGKANNKAITPGERKVIVAALDRMPGIKSYVFEDQKTAYQNFSQDYADNKALIDATRASDMPESYQLMLYPDADWNTITGRLARMPGTSDASNQRCSDSIAKLSAEYGFNFDLWGDFARRVCRPGAG